MSDALTPLLDRAFVCDDCHRQHGVSTRAIVVGDDALVGALPKFIHQVLGAQRILLIGDPITDALAGDTIRHRLGPGVRTWLLSGDQAPSCDGDTVAAATQAAAEARAEVLVALGSGTVNDVVKAAAHRAGVPYVVVPTAASMNGYTSGITAILEGGVKRTIPTPATAGVFAAPDLLATAPLAMTAAGLGDLLSKSVCGADWWLSKVLFDQFWCPLPGRLVEQAEDRSIAVAEGLGRREPSALAELLEALLLSGFAMVVAGSSAPASGAEHLFSHLIDMRRHVTHDPLNLHGAQVGVGTLITAALYERLWQHGPPTEADVQRALSAYPTWSEEEERIHRIHGPLADEILGCYRDKYRPRQEQEAHLEVVRARWSGLKTPVRSVGQLRRALEAAGAPTRVDELGLTQEEAWDVARHCRDMRARYTVLDLCWDLGWLDALLEDALQTSGVLAG